MWENIRVSVITSVITWVIVTLLTFLSFISSTLIADGWFIKKFGGATAREVAELKEQLRSAQKTITAISYEENTQENNYSTVIKAGTGFKFKIQSDGNIALYRGGNNEALWHAMGCSCK